MLVLSRLKGEQIEITLPTGEIILITVVEIHRGRVRIGVKAPRTIRVHRMEVAAAIEAGAVSPQSAGEPEP
jgi:carbon storage regulator